MVATPSFDFDGALKELWERDRPTLLNTLRNGVPIREALNVELPRVQARRADIVYRLDDGCILHIEFQSANDRDIGYRQGSTACFWPSNTGSPFDKWCSTSGAAR